MSSHTFLPAITTRMHSSRMLTARSLTMGGYLPGGVPAWGVYLPGGVPVWGGVPAGGVPALGGTCPGTPPPCGQNS